MRQTIFLAALLLSMTLIPPGQSVAAEPSKITEAERQLFMADHLQGLKVPARLEYKISRRGSLQSELNDSAEVALSANGGKTISKVRFLSGSNEMKLPPIPGVKGNPILLHFLEREIREMSRLTGGSVNYYRKRVRMALAADPVVRDIKTLHAGQSIRARQIRISPYLDDPARSRYEKFATRAYEMVLSEQVPGGIVRLQGELYAPGELRDKTTLLWSETVSFKSHTE